VWSWAIESIFREIFGKWLRDFYNILAAEQEVGSLLAMRFQKGQEEIELSRGIATTLSFATLFV
jgi:hypothetical protein